MRLEFHNPELQALCGGDLGSPDQVETVEKALAAHGTLHFAALPTGLYPASSGAGLETSGYRNVWVRDNVYVALALLDSGRSAEAVRVARALLSFYTAHRGRLRACEQDRLDVMARPHVRFDGTTLEELSHQRWPHAQNDALGYCLWLCARLVRQAVFSPEPDEIVTLDDLARYLVSLPYWEDEDSGHWEETRKRSASSIGTVVAGLEEWSACLVERPVETVAGRLRSDALGEVHIAMHQGRHALATILPSECVQPSLSKNRRYDAALVFLLCPLGVVEGAMADLILHDVRRYLQGRIGIRRYLGDSYWAPDYDSRVAAGDQTRDYSDDLEARDALLESVGDEAQWCLFDPILSVLYGQRHAVTGAESDIARQHLHFRRAMAQITADWQCPELYYRRRGEFVAGPHTPLSWTQANVQLALTALRASAGRRTPPGAALGHSRSPRSRASTPERPSSPRGAGSPTTDRLGGVRGAW